MSEAANESGEADVIPITRARVSDEASDDPFLGVPTGGGDDQRPAELLDFLRRRVTGDYEVDEFGFDPELTDRVLLELIRPLYRHWFRTETVGLHNVPDDSGALVVANHSGTLPLDGLMLQVALHDDHPARRALRLLGADLVYRLPVLGHLSRKTGHTLACREDADRLLRKGELVGVFPEGFKGSASRSPTATGCSASGGAASSPPPSARACRSFPAPSWVPRRSTPRSAICVSWPGR